MTNGSVIFLHTVEKSVDAHPKNSYVEYGESIWNGHLGLKPVNILVTESGPYDLVCGQ